MGDHSLVVLSRYDPGTGVITWNDLTPDVLQAEKVTFQRGVGDESGGLRPSSVGLRLKDLAAVAPTYDPDHPSSPLYGKAGRNTSIMAGYTVALETFEGSGPPWSIPSTNGGTGAWASSSTQAHSGTKSLKSPVIANGQNVDINFTVPAGANIMIFWYWVDSQVGDGFAVFRDPTGVNLLLVNSNTTSGQWVQSISFVQPGEIIRFRYAKDAAGAGGTDTSYIDDLQFIDAHVTGEAASWKPDQNEAFVPGAPSTRGLRWTDLTASGVLRRIGQWSDPLASTMYQQITGYGSILTGYWPMEGGAAISSAVSGVPAANTRGTISYQNADAPGGSEPLVQLGADGTIIGKFLKASSTAGWQFVFSMHLDAAASGTGVLATWTTSNGYVWSIATDGASYSFTVVNSEGIVLSTGSVTFGSSAANVSTNYVTFRMRATVAAGTVTFNPAWYGANDLNQWGTGYSFAGSIGYLTTWRVTGNTRTANARMGHFYGLIGIAPDAFDGTAVPAINGFPGEKAEDRFKRLCALKGVSAVVVGTTGTSLPMGPQRPDEFQDLLQEIANTTAGLIYDTRWQRSVTLRLVGSMYHQTPKLILTRSQCIAPLAKSIDDKGSWNTVTVESRDGRSNVATLAAGPMSTASPPDGIGLYEKKIAGNWYSGYRLSNAAGWWLSVGTVTDPRYSTVSLDLDGAAAALEQTATTVDPGDYIVITDVRPDALPLLVIGIDQTLDTRKHRILTFTTVPAVVHQLVGRYGNPGSRYDAATTTMASQIAAGVTAVPITSVNPREAWVNPGTVDPRVTAAGGTYGQYDVIIAGERCTVTAATAAAGTGPITQTLTVVRAVNGVSKTLPAGAAVHLFTPAHWAL